MIQTENHGPLVRSSTFWGSELAERGLYYLSPNAGCFRLLVPRSRSADTAEMRTAREVVISVGAHRDYPEREMSEMLFDDRTPNPFALLLTLADQWERLPADDDYALFYEFTAWEDRRGTPHKIMSRPCYLRRSNLPCLQPWPKT